MSADDELSALKHDIERHIKIASRLATKNEALRAEIYELRGEINALLRHRVRELEKDRDRWRNHHGSVVAKKRKLTEMYGDLCAELRKLHSER